MSEVNKGMSQEGFYKKLIIFMVAITMTMVFFIFLNPQINAEWKEYSGNPIFGEGVGGPKAYYPSIIYDEDEFSGHGYAAKYKMWYGTSGSRTAFATSDDGIHWTDYGVVMNNGYHATVEYYSSGFPGNNSGDNPNGDTMYYRMWYWTPSVLYDVSAMRYAESPDGINWYNDQPLQNGMIPIITGIWPDWNRGSYGPCDVLYNPNATNTGNNPFNYTFVMYYDGTTGGEECIGLGYSSNGIIWNGYDGDNDGKADAVFTGTYISGDWDYNFVSRATVIKTPSNYEMWYSGGINSMNNGIGYAISQDGINWIRDNNNPLLHRNDGVNWRDSRTYTPMVIKNGTCYTMWFTGKDTAGGNYSIGMTQLCMKGAVIESGKIAFDINGPPLEPGDIIRYEIWINNTGDMDSADNLGNEFEDIIPNNTTYLSGTLTINGVSNDDDISDGIGYDYGNNMIIWNGVLPANGSIKISFYVSVNLDTPSGTVISSQGTVYYDPSNKGVNDMQTVTNDPATPDFNDPTDLLLDYISPHSWLIVTYDPDGYISSTSTFHIMANDDSGIWKILYKIDGVQHEGKWNEKVHFQINQPHGYSYGQHTIEYWAIDSVNNEEPHHVETYILDTTGPSVSMNFEGIYEVTASQKWQISSQTVILLDATDIGCGVASIHYKIDDGEWKDYIAPFTIDEEGVHTLYYYAIDRIGNAGMAGSRTIQIGGGEPVTICDITPERPTGNNEWYVSNVSITLTATDEASGVNYTMYKIDSGEWQKYTKPFVVDGDGIHHIQYYSVDNVGNIEDVKESQIKMDLYGPKISIYKPIKFLYIFDRAIVPLPNGPFIIGKITIMSTIEDTSTSGVESAEIYLDKELKMRFVDEVEYTLDETIFGVHTLKIVAYDKAGNEAVEEIKITIYNA